jgi:hypothetical protein
MDGSRIYLFLALVNLHMLFIQDFDYIVQVHCKDRVGINFIERGDYEVLHAEDSEIIGPSELASTVAPGMKLEMSIVMRQSTADQTRCPRCGYYNPQVAACSGWIEWQVFLNWHGR